MRFTTPRPFAIALSDRVSIGLLGNGGSMRRRGQGHNLVATTNRNFIPFV